MRRLEGKTAVVTGGGTGIGLASAKRFIAEGAFVYIFGRRQAPLDAALAELGPNARAVAGSVADPSDLDRLFEALKAERGSLDVLLANAPYVPTEDIELMPPEARLHEPRMSLDGGTDGLDILRRVIAAAPQWLSPRGHLLVESSKRQAPQLVEAIARCGLAPRVATSDELNATVVIGARQITP